MPDDLPDLGPRKTLAKTLAKKLVKSTGVKTAPVSLQQVIEHLQMTRSLAVMRINNASEKVSGLLVVCREVDDEYATIGFNPNHPWCHRRFTIAHEIGHLLLEHTCAGTDASTHTEKEAHIFAANLLMPPSLLKNDFARLGNLQELAKLYRVSQQALTIQLMDSRLL